MSSFLSSLFGGKPADGVGGSPQPAQSTQSSSSPTTAPLVASVPAPTTTIAERTTNSSSRDDDVHATQQRSILSARSMRQLGLFFGGWTFLAFSIAVSRRAVARHTSSARLQFYQPNHRTVVPSLPGSGSGANAATQGERDPMVAVEALNLATLNVISFAVMMTGGVAFALDVSSVEDLRQMARRSLERGGAGPADEAAEREVAEWVASVLKIKEKDKDEVGKAQNNDGKSQ